jgi:hypothetical protein
MSKAYTVLYDTGDDSVIETEVGQCIYNNLKSPFGCFGTDDDPTGKTLATQFSDFPGNEYAPLTQADIDAVTDQATKDCLTKIANHLKML